MHKVAWFSFGSLALVSILSPTISYAVPFRLGEVGGLLGVTLAYGLQWRTQDPDSELVVSGNGGNSASGNLDDHHI